MCSAFEERRAEEDLGVPGEGKSGPSQTAATRNDLLSVTGVRAEEMTKSRKI
jgi:hypothetical protein